MGLASCQGVGAKGCLGAWAESGMGTAWDGEAVVARAPSLLWELLSLALYRLWSALDSFPELL